MIQLKKLEVEKARVYAARLELELKLEELRESILRVQDHVEIQRKREQELEQQISTFKESN